MNYIGLFDNLHPGYFEQAYIRSLPEDEIYAELVLDLHTFSPETLEIPCPEHITFGLARDAHAGILEAVAQVDEDWVQYFEPDTPVFCAFDGGRIVAFCIVEEMGRWQGLRIRGPGCVGTIPAYRKQGIGLKMVQKATAFLQTEGYDLAYIHYTHLEEWYARLGYETVLRWNCKGICWHREE